MKCIDHSTNFHKGPGKLRPDVPTIRALFRTFTHSRRSLVVADGLFRASLLAPAVHMKERQAIARIEGPPRP